MLVIMEVRISPVVRFRNTKGMQIPLNLWICRPRPARASNGSRMFRQTGTGTTGFGG
jgi:hypothetical protein